MPTIRPFFDVLRELRRGATLEELAEHLAMLTEAVATAQKPGKLTLTLTLAPVARGNGAVFSMHDKISLTLPPADVGSTIFFATDDFQLSRSDPNQLPLGLRVVPEGEPRERIGNNERPVTAAE